MANRTQCFVLDTFTLLNNLSGLQNGATVGELQKMMPYCSKGQLSRLLGCLEEMNFAYHEVKPHGRTGKNVYKMTETAAIHCAAIARQYTERN